MATSNFEEYKIPLSEKATLVSVVCERFEGHKTEAETKASLVELHELLRTLDLESQSEVIQYRKEIEAATIIGQGKLQEIAELAKNEGSKLLVFDFELTASQVRNIKKLTGLEVIDRCTVILEIFAKNARTREAKIQIEISRLQYLLPRLTSMWGHFSKQRGGIGQKGEGEQQLELDRRIIRDRIEFYKRELKEIAVSREEQRKRRKHQAITAALVGYTNAGKSSLMNRLCRVNVLEEDKLFATLDATYRMLNPDTKPPMIMIDTVGFISNLPNTLIEGFKTTLESALEADLLVIVCDASHPQLKKHLEVTKQVLDELKIVNKESIIVFNKKDLIKDPFKEKMLLKTYPGSFMISTHNDDDIKKLRSYIVNHFLELQNHYDLFVPYQEGDVHAKIMAKTNVINTSAHEQGIFYRIRIPEFIFNSLKIHSYILGPTDPKRKEFDPEKKF